MPISDSDSDYEAPGAKRQKRVSASSKQTVSPPPACEEPICDPPEQIYRGGTSRPQWPPAPVVRQWACSDTDDSDENIKMITSETVVRRLMKSYKGYFRNLDDPTDFSFQPDPNDPAVFSFNPNPYKPPIVELEYPNAGYKEKFILLAPKDKDHYNPIMDLESTLYTIVECYLTPEQQAKFGTLPTDSLLQPVSRPSLHLPTRIDASSRSDISDTDFSEYDYDDDDEPVPGSSLPSTPDMSPAPGSPAKTDHLRALRRAIHTHDGPLFMATMSHINELLRSMKYPSNSKQEPFVRTVDKWTTEIPKKVLMRILEENYQRCVGPNVPSLKQYEAFTSTVYGELMPSLVYEIIKTTGVNENMLLLDLGSGVGNILVQASLQTGCRSYGIELMPAPAKIAREMVEQFRMRCRMWGLRMGQVDLEEGDMLESADLDRLIPQADVILVDNKVFKESLNEALRPKFLDLKENAVVVSLAPFVPPNARVTERNVDSITSIFEVTEKPYRSGSVSWASGAGHYYIHRVDRDGYSKVREQFHNTRTTTTTSSGRISRPRNTY
ncbi:S-adenosyl-L-methionine-dependent methyltransferase [Mycena floridula]|nr:S-adenosyl-L-methionine-dependent methyltransferase [Mycena floridula]